MKGWTYGYWCHHNGASYWGIRLANVVPIGKTVHHLSQEVKLALVGWRFK